jgi:hypothetical protein
VKLLKRGVVLLTVLVVSATIVLIRARVRNDPDWFGTSLTPSRVLWLLEDAAPGMNRELPTAMRGVEVRDLVEGHDSWILVDLPSAGDVAALKDAVVNQAGQIARRQGAFIRHDEIVKPYPLDCPPRWWADSRTADREPLYIVYGGTGVYDVWVFSRSQRRAYFLCHR